MDLSRRGFFKGVAALFAGAVAAQLPSCSTGAAPLAVAQEPIVDVVKDQRVSRWLPYSTDPLIEGLTPLPENLLEPGPRVG